MGTSQTALPTQTNVDQAEAVWRNSKNSLEDLRGRIDFEVRNALLDLQWAETQVTVARTNVDLANQTLVQARDRFSVGVTDNLEVVQAQQSLAAANGNYIGALGAHNAAKIALATAVGTAEDRCARTSTGDRPDNGSTTCRSKGARRSRIFGNGGYREPA